MIRVALVDRDDLLDVQATRVSVWLGALQCFRGKRQVAEFPEQSWRYAFMPDRSSSVERVVVSLDPVSASLGGSSFAPKS